MTQNKLNFKTEKLSVDYITLNLKNAKTEIEKLSQFFDSYQFNSYLYDFKTERRQPFLVNDYKYELTFILHSCPTNKDTILIQFSGIHSRYFFDILKTELFPWSSFSSSVSLGRIDINYTLENLPDDHNKFNLQSFYKRSIEKYTKRYPSAKTEIFQNKDSLNLAFSTRKGDYFLRIYQSDENSLKFELEIKKSTVKLLTSYLLNYSMLEFEDAICHRFYNYLKIALTFDFSYTDWLIPKFRKKENNHLPSSYIVSTYFQQELVHNSIDDTDQLFIYNIFRILSFSRHTSLKKENLNGISYYTCTFPLIDFARDIGIVGSKDILQTYQRKKLIQFFKELQKLPPLQRWLNDLEFVSIVGFPIIKIQNQRQTTISLSISEELYHFNYPFYFPKSFYTYKNKTDLRIKFQIISRFSQPGVQKEFFIQDFLSQYQKSNGQKKKEVKTILIQQFQSLVDYKIIQKEFLFHRKDNSITKSDQITIDSINSIKSFVVYEIIR